MAVRDFVPSKKKQSKRSVILFFLVSAIVCLAVAGSIVNYAKAAENKDKAIGVSNECEQVKTDNEELERFLKNENHDEYYEKIAREKYGYAKPGERVFYDSSFGN